MASVKLPVTFLYKNNGIGSGTEEVETDSGELTLKKLAEQLTESKCLERRNDKDKFVIGRVRWTTDKKNLRNIQDSKWYAINSTTDKHTFDDNELKEITLLQADTILVPIK